MLSTLGRGEVFSTKADDDAVWLLQMQERRPRGEQVLSSLRRCSPRATPLQLSPQGLPRRHTRHHPVAMNGCCGYRFGRRFGLGLASFAGAWGTSLAVSWGDTEVACGDPVGVACGDPAGVASAGSRAAEPLAVFDCGGYLSVKTHRPFASR